MIEAYLADSYAFLALVEGNERYRRIFQRGGIQTTALNVVEVYWALLRRMDPDEALAFSSALLSRVVDVPPEAALRAAEFRRRMALEKKHCSHIDAWGYCAAQALGLRFLTGDPVFKGLDNVEFVR